jgi:transposase
MSLISCFLTYSRFTASSRPLVDTNDPLAQKRRPTMLRLRSPYTLYQVDFALESDEPDRLRHAILRRDVIPGISVSPRRQRLNLHFQLYTENIRQLQARDFLRQLLRQIRGHIVVLWDGGNPHRGTLVRELCTRTTRLHLQRVPAYAPEFNPDEGVWKLAKQRLVNGEAHDLPELMVAVIDTLQTIRANRRNLRGCITDSALPPSLR